MRIAQVAPLHESVPPKLYGGTERVVHYLTEELVSRGHEVTLFASGDSDTRARLQAVVPQALRLNRNPVDPLVFHLLMLDQVSRMAEDFDVIHFHTDFLHFPLSRYLTTPHLTTLHGRLDIADLLPLYRNFSDIRVVSISDSQRHPLPMANWFATVYNGVPEQLFHLRSQAGSYLAFLGRISPEKGTEQAIEIAIRSEMPLKIAAKVDKVDQAYYEARIKPLLAHPLVEYVGEISDKEKDDFLGNAYALLFPIDWPEPFGLVMIEAMACGTPVIAFPRGAVPEVMRHSRTGFVVDDIEQAIAAVRDIHKVRREDCRRHFDAHFSARRMADGYLSAYARVIAAQGERATAWSNVPTAVLARRRDHEAVSERMPFIPKRGQNTWKT
ncbi:MAG: glycosyltransferase family 4 protein [Proteobacteria bacterium]|nr:glycosyltransferase family 4 protein [Pseudomonadota bacterium]